LLKYDYLLKAFKELNVIIKRGDAMSKELQQLDAKELDCLFASISTDPDQVAANLFPDQPSGCRTITERIGEWAIHQKMVLENNAEGRDEIALVFEKVCDRIWRHLPEYARRVKVRFDAGD
jgi:hypothetical protein